MLEKAARQASIKYTAHALLATAEAAMIWLCTQCPCEDHHMGTTKEQVPTVKQLMLHAISPNAFKHSDINGYLVMH